MGGFWKKLGKDGHYFDWISTLLAGSAAFLVAIILVFIEDASIYLSIS